MILAWVSAASWGCGGFFCDGGYYTTTGDYTVPVEQNGERILFEVNPDDTVTTFVEVAYQQTVDVDFAWVIPIPTAIDASAVTTASADLFNALELATAPEFTFHWTNPYGYGGYTGYDDFEGSPGCGCGCGGLPITTTRSTTPTGASPESFTTAVQVLDFAVVGPLNVQVITASDGAAFADWLATNGYELPDNAVDPLQHYIDLNMAFLGVKLAPDVPEGPIDTLEFTYPSTMPMIPLILTAIASVDDLPIQAYVLADDPYIPAGWAIAPDVAPFVQPDGDGGTDYLDRVAEALDDYGGQAMELELAEETDRLTVGEFDALLHQRAWLTRWRAEISPDEMTVDPEFVPEDLPAYTNRHDIQLPYARGSTPADTGSTAWIGFGGFGLFGWWRRRRSGIRRSVVQGDTLGR